MTDDRPDINMSRPEFVALIAMMFAIIAFSTDAMLPALPEIGAELSPLDMTKVPLIVTAFILGMGMGTFVTGPLSDAFGRKNIIYLGSAIYISGAVVAWLSQSLEVMLIARVVQGVGAAGPREMAKIMSFVMMIFVVVPAFAPAMGAVIIALSDWRGVFLSFIVFSATCVVWAMLRLPETLPKPKRRPLQIGLLWNAVKEIFSNPMVCLSITVQTLVMGFLFSTLMLVQPIYDQVYDRAESFPFWFGVAALISGTSSLLNALLVVRLGMQRIVILALGLQIVLSGLMLGLGLGDLPEPYGFVFFLMWQASLFFQVGLVMGNLNALAMEPLGHIAGMAASVIGAVSTVMAAMLASPIGLMFNGTITPLIGAVLTLATLAFALMLLLARVNRQAAADPAE